MSRFTNAKFSITGLLVSAVPLFDPYGRWCDELFRRRTPQKFR